MAEVQIILEPNQLPLGAKEACEGRGVCGHPLKQHLQFSVHSVWCRQLQVWTLMSLGTWWKETWVSHAVSHFPPSCHTSWPWVVQVVLLAAQSYWKASTCIFRENERICEVVCGYIVPLAVSRLMQNFPFLSFRVCYKDNRRNVWRSANLEVGPWDYREVFWNLGILAETWGILAKILFNLFSSVCSGIGKC